MLIIKLNAIDSTNAYLKKVKQTQVLQDNTVVQAQTQTKGKGQLGAVWYSEPGKNLTFSILKCLKNYPVVHAFILNMKVCMALINALEKIGIPDLSVKWPNDILSANKKIAGVLIENSIKDKYITHSIIGIGLNVNQIHFDNLPKASSLQKITAKHYDIQQVLEILLQELKSEIHPLSDKALAQLQKQYQAVLFRKDKPSTFKDTKGTVFMGFIKGVSLDGKLQLCLEDNIPAAFALKEIELLY